MALSVSLRSYDSAQARWVVAVMTEDSPKLIQPDNPVLTKAAENSETVVQAGPASETPEEDSERAESRQVSSARVAWRTTAGGVRQVPPSDGDAASCCTRRPRWRRSLWWGLNREHRSDRRE